MSAALFVAPSAFAAATDTTASQNGTTTAAMELEWINPSGAAWIWPAAAVEQNQYAQFVHDFELPADAVGSAKMAVSVDTNYAVWLNGEFVDFGQWSDFPKDKTFDLLDLKALARPGANRLCILAWYQGLSSSMYLKGDPGALYAVQAGGKTAAVSGPDTRMRRAPDYVSGASVPRVSGQLSFTFEHHANKSDGWLGGDYKLGDGWTAPAADEIKPLASRPVRPRPVAKLTLGKRLPMRVVTQGAFLRNASVPNRVASAATAVQSDYLGWRPPGELIVHPQGSLSGASAAALQFKPEAWRDATGPYVVLDTGREEAGLLDLEIDAPAGAVVDIAYGEHLEDMRVRAHVGGRNFACRYVTAAGRQSFLHPFLRAAGRYIQVHVTPPADAPEQPITLHYAGMRPTDYPVSHAGSFTSPDALQNQIWEVSKRTLHLCMHEHYEDCPWREQAMYGMDGRNQMLAGYYCFGNYDFAKASIALLGQGWNEEDGFLELCAPASVAVNIPSFSLAYILCVDDSLLFSGDREFVRSQMPVVRKILQTCERESTSPVILTPTGPRMWNFYEWAPGVDGNYRLEKGQVQYDAPLNLFYLLALDAAARMARECGEDGEEFARKSRELKAVFASTFWDPAERAFRTRVGNNQGAHFAELTQALAILAQVVPVDELPALRQRLAADGNGWVPCTISHTLYKFEALLTDKERYAPRVFELIARDWSFMLNRGATSFWETIDGAAAFADAGSLCHGWSGIPAWFYGKYILGVTPTAPGFAETEMDPVAGIVPYAEGVIPTPSGALKASWRTETGKLVKELTPVAGKD